MSVKRLNTESFRSYSDSDLVYIGRNRDITLFKFKGNLANQRAFGSRGNNNGKTGSASVQK